MAGRTSVTRRSALKPKRRVEVLTVPLLVILAVAIGARPSPGKAAEPRVPIEGWRLPGGRPDFSIRDMENRTVRLADFKGRRLLVVFFATCCCLHCPTEMPALSRMERKLRERGISILGVSIDSVTTEVVKQYLKRWGVEFPVIHDTEGVLFRAFRLEGIPTMYFVGPDGRLEGRTKGVNMTRWDDPRVRRVLEAWTEGRGLPFALIPPEETDDLDDEDEGEGEPDRPPRAKGQGGEASG